MDRDAELAAIRGWTPDSAAEREARSALVDELREASAVPMDRDVSLAEGALFASARRIAQATQEAEQRMRNMSPEVRRRADPEQIAGPRSPSYRSAWTSRLRSNSISAEHRDALTYGEVRDQTHGTGSSGAYLVPQDFGNAVAVSQSFNGAMRSVAKILETPGDSRTLPLPTTDASSAGAATILAENTVPNEATDPVFAAVTLHGFPFVCPGILYPFSLVTDTAYTPMPQGVSKFEPGVVANRPSRVGGVDLVGLLAEIGGLRLALGQEPYFATGTGSAQPQGAFTATASVTTASPTAITWTEIVALYTSLNVAYRNTASWMMSTATWKLLQDLEDSAGKPLWNPAFGPAAILGRPVVINDSAPAPTATNKSIVFADFSRYYVIRTGGVISIPLVERYADALLGALIVAEFADGAIYDSKAGVTLAMHA
ncbi:MAG: phage major capsid protein [Candidatus Dormiibacterota bacterium]